MNSKKSSFTIQYENVKDPVYAKEFPTISDLLREQKVLKDKAGTVHHRRDLDSLG